MKRGLFISFEGSEGCGKSTQIALLAELLAGSGRDVECLREPGGTPLGESIRHLLKYADEGRGMCVESELLLFAASRAQLVRQRIAPALDRGMVVLCDRFLDSTTVYQGVARRLAPGDVAEINRVAVAGHLPDTTILLDMEAGEAMRRAEGRKGGEPARSDRMEQEPESFYRAVRDGYLALAAGEPGRIAVVDATPAAESVHRSIIETLERKHHGIFKGTGG